jgi:hypothetical protein
MVLVDSSRRSDSVVFPWSMWAMIEKLRVSSVDMGMKNQRGRTEGKQEIADLARKIKQHNHFWLPPAIQLAMLRA